MNHSSWNISGGDNFWGGTHSWGKMFRIMKKARVKIHQLDASETVKCVGSNS